MERLRVLTSHLSVCNDGEALAAENTAGEATTYAQFIRTALSMTVCRPKPKETITVIDNRTGKRYEVNIRNNAVPAPAFAKIVFGDEPLRYRPSRGQISLGLIVCSEYMTLPSSTLLL